MQDWKIRHKPVVGKMRNAEREAESKPTDLTVGPIVNLPIELCVGTRSTLAKLRIFPQNVLCPHNS